MSISTAADVDSIKVLSHRQGIQCGAEHWPVHTGSGAVRRRTAPDPVLIRGRMAHASPYSMALRCISLNSMGLTPTRTLGMRLSCN